MVWIWWICIYTRWVEIPRVKGEKITFFLILIIMSRIGIRTHNLLDYNFWLPRCGPGMAIKRNLQMCWWVNILLSLFSKDALHDRVECSGLNTKQGGIKMQWGGLPGPMRVQARPLRNYLIFYIRKSDGEKEVQCRDHAIPRYKGEPHGDFSH